MTKLMAMILLGTALRTVDDVGSAPPPDAPPAVAPPEEVKPSEPAPEPPKVEPPVEEEKKAELTRGAAVVIALLGSEPAEAFRVVPRTGAFSQSADGQKHLMFATAPGGAAPVVLLVQEGRRSDEMLVIRRLPRSTAKISVQPLERLELPAALSKMEELVT